MPTCLLSSRPPHVRCSIKQVSDNLHGNISLDPVRQHCRIDDEGGDCAGERRELVAAGLGGTALVSGDRGGC
ncbi:hypothetical protein TRIUR3_21639 [Triticum urartu]|uniref:Uncharacterized protein n=1 Tax=Triticum urartu TaxID=4572 RepID=M7YRW5_TRIUA|nr:hypothetical protein TRIUR3_21639 [Triticum urartu]